MLNLFPQPTDAWSLSRGEAKVGKASLFLLWSQVYSDQVMKRPFACVKENPGNTPTDR